MLACCCCSHLDVRGLNVWTLQDASYLMPTQSHLINWAYRCLGPNHPNLVSSCHNLFASPAQLPWCCIIFHLITHMLPSFCCLFKNCFSPVPRNESQCLSCCTPAHKMPFQFIIMALRLPWDANRKVEISANVKSMSFGRQFSDAEFECFPWLSYNSCWYLSTNYCSYI